MTIKQAIEQALKGESKLKSEDINKLEGFSIDAVWHLLNNLVNGKKTYLEVGCYKGGTLSAATHNNNVKSYGVDNFVLDSSTREICMKNVNHIPDLTFFDQDAYTVDPKEIGPIDVYFYDGDHSFESHYKGLVHFYPSMANEFIYVCDDWNMKRIPNAANQATRDLNLTVIEKHELFCDPQNGDKTWWNGIGIIKFRKND